MGSTFSTASFSTGIHEMMGEFKISEEVASLGTSLILMGFAFGPLIWAPVSELYGRKLPMVVPYFVAVCFTFGTAAAKDTQTLLITRFFAGFFGSAPLCITGGVLADMFSPQQRGLALTGYALAVIGGPVLGPIVGGGVMYSGLGWRWTQLITGIIMAVMAVLDFSFIEESYPPILLVRKARRLRLETRNWSYHAQHEERDATFREMVTKFVIRPIQLLMTPICFFSALHASFVYGIVYLNLGSFPRIFQGARGWNALIGSLAFICLFIGACLGSLVNTVCSRWYVAQLKVNNGRGTPEHRLPPMMIGAVFLMAGLFMIGNTADPDSFPWIVPMIAATMMGLGFFTIFQSVIAYQIDTFPQYAASAVAANTFMRTNETPGTPTLGGDQGQASTHPTPPPDTGRLLAGEIEASLQSPEAGDDAQAIVQDIDPDQSHQTDSEAQQRIFNNSVTSPPLVVEPFVSPPVASIRASQDHGLIDAITSPASCHGAVPALVETQLERFPLVDSPEQQQAGSTPHPPRLEITGIDAIFPITQNSPASSEWTDQQTDTIAPPGLFEAAKFPQDMIYYHHLCDPSLSGLLSVLGVRDVLGVGGLDKGFFHAALALSALHMSQSSSVSKVVADCAALHALDHFVDALGYMRSAHLSDGIATIDAPGRGQNTIAWLATLLLLANFELNRGQIKLWIAAYLEIFDRSYTACHSLATSNVSAMLGTSLRTSTDPSDRLLYILPRVGEFEEECRTSPQLDSHWRMQARGLIDELKAWRRSLPDRDVPSADEVDADPWKLSEDGSTLIIRPLTLSRAANPAKAATSFMHYLVSLVRLEMKYSPGVRRKLPENGRKLILVACRLAAGVSSSVCAASNAYGHGMVPALMNAYYSSDDQAAKEWIKDWISGFPRDREGIWNVRHAHRLLQYIDQEYSQRGSRLGWEVIKIVSQ
ncbi:hypothetical protein Neosp_009411 [[Neocosmospora] mangrovei]